MPIFPLLATTLTYVHRQPAAFVSFDSESATRGYPGFKIDGVRDERKRSKVMQMLTKTLSDYPVEELAQEVSSVFVVRKMSWQDVDFGGTHNTSESTVILAQGRCTESEYWMRHTLHHELAHLLMAKHADRFPRKEWIALNGQPYRFGEDENGGYAALAQGQADLGFRSELNAQGLLSTYASSSFDEDWACYGEQILADNPDFWKLVRKYPRVRAKAKMVEAFYRSVFPEIQLREIPDPV